MSNYFTIAGFSVLRGVKIPIDALAPLQDKADAISTELGYEIGKSFCLAMGTVNTYHIDVLNEVFGNA
jgi:hypothetical protein